MPQQKKPIKQRPRVEDESTGNPPDRRGPHQPWDEALPGKGGTKAGLNRYSGVARRPRAGAKHRRAPDPTGDTRQNRGQPRGHGGHRRDEPGSIRSKREGKPRARG